LAARGSQAWGSLSGDILTTRGITSCLPSGLSGCFDGIPTPFPDAFANRSASASAGVRLSDALTAGANVLYTHGWTAFDGDGFDDGLQFQEKIFGAHLDAALSDAWHLRLMAGRDVDDE